jgi:hypothetical protein
MYFLKIFLAGIAHFGLGCLAQKLNFLPDALDKLTCVISYSMLKKQGLFLAKQPIRNLKFHQLPGINILKISASCVFKNVLLYP